MRGEARGERLKVSAEAALAAAFLYYIGDFKVIAAVLLPVAAHELGHVAALRALGLRIVGFRAELKGFCIDYAGDAGPLSHALAAFAGPLAGLMYALCAAVAGNRSELPWFHLTAGVSLLLSIFNLLPALPLDGGRIALAALRAALGDGRGTRACLALSALIGAAMLAAGIFLLFSGGGAAPLIAAIWLLLYQNDGEGIENQSEII